MPDDRYRLQSISQQAYASALLIGKANQALAHLGDKTTLSARGQESLAHVTDAIRDRVQIDAA